MIRQIGIIFCVLILLCTNGFSYVYNYLERTDWGPVGNPTMPDGANDAYNTPDVWYYKTVLPSESATNPNLSHFTNLTGWLDNAWCYPGSTTAMIGKFAPWQYADAFQSNPSHDVAIFFKAPVSSEYDINIILTNPYYAPTPTDGQILYLYKNNVLLDSVVQYAFTQQEIDSNQKIHSTQFTESLFLNEDDYIILRINSKLNGNSDVTRINTFTIEQIEPQPDPVIPEPVTFILSGMGFIAVLRKKIFPITLLYLFKFGKNIPLDPGNQGYVF